MDRYIQELNKSFLKQALLSEQLRSHGAENDDLNLKMNSAVSDYLNNIRYDHKNLTNFSNALYLKFKKIFLMQLHVKKYNFIPTPEINERQKLLNWLRNPRNYLDLSKYYLPIDENQDILYRHYLDLFDLNNLTTKKVFYLTLYDNKNYGFLKNLLFYANYESAYKKAHALFLTTGKNNIDFKDNSILNFEYYNANWYYNYNIDFTDL